MEATKPMEDSILSEKLGVKKKQLALPNAFTHPSTLINFPHLKISHTVLLS